ncbi:kinetochore-associated Ndc80 complex subunit nuf2 [Chytriomyces hyalinus]|nr:kinetochore-associated Ndc80 complex subunit nuf2 [Chytriomyces hyalinus]
MQQHHYSFPMLKPSEIVTCMSDLHIHVSLEDLERPTPSRMAAVFDAFTSTFMGVSRDSCAVPSFHVVDMLEHPDLHQDDVALMAFYRQLFKLVTEVGIHDFSIRDLIKPEPGHVRKILSAIINFAKFREERVSVFEQCNKNSAEHVQKKAFLEEKNQEIAETVNTIRLQRAEEEPAYQRVRERNLAQTAELRELKRIQTALTSDIENLKKTKADAVEKMNNTNFLLSNTKQDCVRLRSRIVPNPAKLQQALVDMTNSISSEKTNLTVRERQYRDLLTRMEAIAVVQQDITTCTKLMEECEFEMKKSSTAEKSLVHERENIERKNQELREVNIKEQQLKRQLANISDKITRLTKQQTAKKEANDLKMSELAAAYEAGVTERDLNQAKIDSNQAVLAELEEKIVVTKKNVESEIARFLDCYSKLKTRGDRYCAELARMMSS